MSETVHTWHYGLMARHWAEHHTTGPEIAYYQRLIEHYGQPALDAGCGTGRLLIPFLQAGLDVDGCDVSGDMLALLPAGGGTGGSQRRNCIAKRCTSSICRGSTKQLWPVACLALASAASRIAMALQRFYEHLVPGGVLLLEGHPAYSDAQLWPLWRKEARSHLPEPWPAELGTRTR